MAQIHLDKELLSKELFADVLFVVVTSPAAMGNGGLVQFITRDNTEYFFNLLEDDLKCSEVEEFFPFLQLFKKEGVTSEDWHRIYLGLGSSMAIKDEVFSDFKEFAEEYQTKNYSLFQNWRRVVRKTLKVE